MASRQSVARLAAPSWPWRLFEAPNLPGCKQPPLLGFAVRPSIDTIDHGCVTSGVATRGFLGTTEKRAPSTWFHTTSTALTASDLRAYCSPLPILGFVVFRAMRPAGHLPKQGRRNRRVPHNAVRTLRRIPLVDSRTASPRPLPSCRSPRRSRLPKQTRGHRRPGWAPIHRSGSPHTRPHTAEAVSWYVKRSRAPRHLSPGTRPSRRVGFRALLHRRVRNIVPPFPAERCPILPWALFPFKVNSEALDTRRARSPRRFATRGREWPPRSFGATREPTASRRFRSRWLGFWTHDDRRSDHQRGAARGKPRTAQQAPAEAGAALESGESPDGDCVGYPIRSNPFESSPARPVRVPRSKLPEIARRAARSTLPKSVRS
jgi:hypothetical protein